jgi:hypothetical protein
MLKLLKLTPEEFTLFKNKLEEGLEPREPATSWEERLQTLKKFKHGAGAE